MALSFQLKWNSKIEKFELSPSDNILSLQKKLQEISGIVPEKQKIIGLTKTKPFPSSDTILSTLGLKSINKLILLAEAAKEEEEGCNNRTNSSSNNNSEDMTALKKFDKEVEELETTLSQQEQRLATAFLAKESLDKEKEQFDLRKIDHRLSQIVEAFDLVDMTNRSSTFRELRKQKIIAIQKMQTRIDSLLKKL